MIKAYDTSADGTPLLIFGITPDDARLLVDGQCISTTIRSRNGVEAFLMVTGGPTDTAMRERMTALGVAVVESVPASELQDLDEVVP